VLATGPRTVRPSAVRPALPVLRPRAPGAHARTHALLRRRARAFTPLLRHSAPIAAQKLLTLDPVASTRSLACTHARVTLLNHGSIWLHAMAYG
jgi:hypothetical protein